MSNTPNSNKPRIVAEVPEDLKLKVENLLAQKGMTWVGLIKLLLIQWVKSVEKELNIG